MPARVTLKDVAAATGFSANTVSLAMRDSPRLPEETKQTIRETAKQLNYRPNRMAQALKGGSTKTVGILMPILADLGHLGFFRAAEKVFRDSDYHIMMEVTTPNRLESAFDEVRQTGVDGIIVFGGKLSDETAKLAEGLAFVYASNYPPESTEFDRVDWDGLRAARLAMEHLLELGHKRIALLTAEGGPKPWRRRGYRTALEKAGIQLDPDLDYYIPYGEFSRREVERAASELMGIDDPPTAVFVFHDELAVKLVTALNTIGLSVPADVSIVSVNDIWYAEYCSVPLTTIQLRAEEHGRTAAELLLKRLAKPELPPQIVTIDPKLVIRESTATPKA